MNNAVTILPAGWRLIGALSCLTFVGGCSDGPRRHTVSGQVTFEGRPVPRGEISFEPDSAAGETGPGCVAAIRAGNYQTPAGLGAQSGEYRVRIIHLPQENESLATVEPLWFTPYETTVTLPAEASRHDFDITP